VASVGLLPLGIALFGGTARLGPLVNLPVIPWWTLLVVPLSLLGTALQVLHDGAGAGLARGGVAVRAQLAGPAAVGGASAGDVVAGRGAGLGSAGGAAGGVLVAAATRCQGLAGWPAAVPAAAVAGAERPAEGSWSCWCTMSARARRCWCARRGMLSGTTWGRRPGARAASGSWFRHCGRSARRRRSRCCSATTTWIMPATCRPAPSAAGLQLLAPPGSTIAGAGRCQRGLRWHWDGVDFRCCTRAGQPAGRKRGQLRAARGQCPWRGPASRRHRSSGRTGAVAGVSGGAEGGRGAGAAPWQRRQLQCAVGGGGGSRGWQWSRPATRTASATRARTWSSAGRRKAPRWCPRRSPGDPRMAWRTRAAAA
jgi:hypothetical protein